VLRSSLTLTRSPVRVREIEQTRFGFLRTFTPSDKFRQRLTALGTFRPGSAASSSSRGPGGHEAPPDRRRSEDHRTGPDEREASRRSWFADRRRLARISVAGYRGPSASNGWIRPGHDCPTLRLARATNGARNAGRTERLAVALQLGGTFDRSRRSWSITFSSLGLPVRSRVDTRT